MKTAKNQVRPSHAGATPLKRLLATCGFNFSHDGAQRDWSTWHRRYNENEHLKARLHVVRQTVRAVLDDCRTGKIRLISICSGDGRDILEELAKHPRRNDIEAWLIDSDRPSIVRGEAIAAEVGLTQQVHFRLADAGVARSYTDIAPAEVLLLSGFLGRLTYDELAHVIGCLPSLCTSGTAVVWSRHVYGNLGIDTPRVHELLRNHGFGEVKFIIASPNGYEVGWHRFIGIPQSLDPELTLFNAVPVEIPRSDLFREPHDSCIGKLTFDRGRWTTCHLDAGSHREIRIFLNTTEVGPSEAEILAVQRFLLRLPEHTRTLRQSDLMGWSYYPHRIAAKRNGELEVRYRSSLRFLPSKSEIVPNPQAIG
jgi:hypothetical protein